MWRRLLSGLVTGCQSSPRSMVCLHCRRRSPTSACAWSAASSPWVWVPCRPWRGRCRWRGGEGGPGLIVREAGGDCCSGPAPLFGSRAFHAEDGDDFAGFARDHQAKVVVVFAGSEADPLQFVALERPPASDAIQLLFAYVNRGCSDEAAAQYVSNDPHFRPFLRAAIVGIRRVQPCRVTVGVQVHVRHGFGGNWLSGARPGAGWLCHAGVRAGRAERPDGPLCGRVGGPVSGGVRWPRRDRLGLGFAAGSPLGLGVGSLGPLGGSPRGRSGGQELRLRWRLLRRGWPLWVRLLVVTVM